MQRPESTNERIAALLLNSVTPPEATTNALWKLEAPIYPKPATGVFTIKMGLEPGTSRLAFKRCAFWARIDNDWQKTYYFRCTRRNEYQLHDPKKILVHSYMSLLRSSDRKADGFIREIFVVLDRFSDQSVQPHAAVIIQRSSSTETSAMVNELTPYTSWSLSFQWERTDRPPSQKWWSLWGQNEEHAMWHMSRAEHQALMSFFIPFIRLSTVIFCPLSRPIHHSSPAFNNTVISVRETCLPHLLGPEEELCYQRISTILKNPFTKLSLPPLMWKAMRDPATATDAVHWMDEYSRYEGAVNDLRLFHGVGTWDFGPWQYAGQFLHGLPHGLGTITERQQGTGVIKSVYEGELYGGIEHGFGRKSFFDASGTRIILTFQGKWVTGHLSPAGDQNLYRHYQLAPPS